MSAASARKPATIFIFVTLVIAVMGVGLIIPVLPGLITEFEGGDVAEASHVFGWIVGIFALMQFLGSPLLGALSDRFGRRRRDRARSQQVIPTPRAAGKTPLMQHSPAGMLTRTTLQS